MDNITSVTELVDEVNSKMKELVNDLPQVRMNDMGLDERAGYDFTVDVKSRSLIIPLQYDGTLQYYGAFEYVDAKHREVLGDYVIYSQESKHGETCDRIKDCFDYYQYMN